MAFFSLIAGGLVSEDQVTVGSTVTKTWKATSSSSTTAGYKHEP